MLTLASNSKLNICELEGRNLPSQIVYALNNHLTIQKEHISSYFPFDGYDGPLDFESNNELIVVSPSVGGGPRVKVISVDNPNVTYFDEMVFEDSNFRGGVNVALCDINNDNHSDILVGAGVGGGPRIKLYLNDGNNHFTLSDDYFAFNSDFRGGVNVDGWNNHYAIFPGLGGGPVVNVDGKYGYYGNPDDRNFVDWAFNVDEHNNPQIIALTNDRHLVVNGKYSNYQLYIDYKEIGFNNYSTQYFSSFYATRDDGQFDEIDPNFGIILFHENFSNGKVRVGNNYVVNGIDGIDNLSINVLAGTSIGSDRGTGTLTLKINDNLGLTNRHVIENSDFNTPINSPVYGPGPADTPKNTPLHKIGNVIAKSNINFNDYNEVDAALFTLDNPSEVSNDIIVKDYDPYSDSYVTKTIKIDGFGELKAGDIAYKVGRTTNLTRGLVINDDSQVVVNYGSIGTATYIHQNVILSNEGFSAPGDSGSPVFTPDDKGGVIVCGQLFAGGTFTTIVTDISSVLGEFNAKTSTS
jgi:V8-like Glu-specific endopeptidase